MSTAIAPAPIGERSPRSRARIAGAFYLATFVTGIASLVIGGRAGMAFALVAGACYVVVTLLLYGVFKPVSRSVSALAAVVSLIGFVLGVLGPLGLLRPGVSNLVFFGVYCLLLGWLVYRSRFMPKALAALLALAGLGWLVYLSPPLASSLYPWVLAPGIVGEGALTLWLLAVGVDSERWLEQAQESAKA
jgi:hypothetical protein